MNVIPVVNCHYKDFDCVKEKVAAAGAFSEWVHLDIADGAFTFGKSWNEPGELRSIVSPLKYEVHLMVERPEAVLDDWLAAGAKRIIFHLEAVRAGHPSAGSANSPQAGSTTLAGTPQQSSRQAGQGDAPEAVIAEMLKKCSGRNVEVMLATNPETPAAALVPYLALFDGFHVLAQVAPGPGGQPFLPVVLEKISFLRSRCPGKMIEVDGGMVPETIRRVKDAGADTVVSGTYLFGSRDPKRSYEELCAI